MKFRAGTSIWTGPRDWFGLGLISTTGLSVRSCNFSEPSVRFRSRSKMYGPIGRTRTEPRYYSMTVSINQTFKALYHATYQYFNLTDTEVPMHRTHNHQESPFLFDSLLALSLSR